ncbi:MAG: hypothetical protein KGJ62_04020 [Armatimonadetes bacterium]|nr:hypothetical protein [Armatimonadota bacterium]MDE2205649.1 hypothetical protein [Armatimonadota bacterium]
MAFISKWLHVMSIIGVLGGSFFMWLLLCTITVAPESPAADLIKAQWRKAGMALMGLWVVVLVTGFYNYYVVSPHVAATYHMLVGMKIGIVMLMLVLSVAMLHPVKIFAPLQQKRAVGMLILVLLGIVVIGISSRLNMGRVDGSLLRKPDAAVSPPAAPGATVTP